jgi:hypothetical protein
MPATEFSEFTYGYAVMRETETFLTKHAGALTRAPEQPSLIKENTVGYDAKLVTVDLAVLLQFKVPFFTSRQHTRGACGLDHCTWSAWRREHFRVWVDVGSNQQSAMREYERQIDSGAYLGLSCYVTPAYWKQRGHDIHYARGQVLDQSAAPLPSLFDGLGGKHAFSYETPSGQCVVMSEARDGEHKSLGDRLRGTLHPGSIPRQGSIARGPRLDTFVAENPVTQRVELDRGAYEMRSARGAVAYLKDSAALLGAAFVLMGHVNAGAQ